MMIERKISKFLVLIRTKMLIIAWIYLMMVKTRVGKEEQSEKMTYREARVVRTDTSTSNDLFLYCAFCSSNILYSTRF